MMYLTFRSQGTHLALDFLHCLLEALVQVLSTAARNAARVLQGVTAGFGPMTSRSFSIFRYLSCRRCRCHTALSCCSRCLARASQVLYSCLASVICSSAQPSEVLPTHALTDTQVASSFLKCAFKFFRAILSCPLG